MSFVTDALVTAEDIQQIKADLGKDYWLIYVLEAIGREPALLLLVSEHFEKLLRMVADVLPEDQREAFRAELALLVWSPLIVLGRAHRRLWDGFLPDESTADDNELDELEDEE